MAPPNITRTPKPRLSRRASGSFGTTPGLGKATFTNDVGSGLSASEEYLVTELSGDVKTILANAARNRSIPQVGTIGRFGPEIEIPVRNVTARLASDSSTTQARVTVQYGYPQGGGGFENDPDDPRAVPQLEVGTSLQPTTTNFNVHGTELAVTYIPQIDTDDDGIPDSSGTVPDTPLLAEVEYMQPMTTVIYRRKERNNPLAKSQAYAGQVDSDTNPFVFGERRKHHWLCMRIAGTTDDGGQTFDVTYEFQRHRETWDPVIAYIDPELGAPPADIKESATSVNSASFAVWTLRQGNEAATHSAIYRDRVYPENAFRALELYI